MWRNIDQYLTRPNQRKQYRTINNHASSHQQFFFIFKSFIFRPIIHFFALLFITENRYSRHDSMESMHLKLSFWTNLNWNAQIMLNTLQITNNSIIILIEYICPQFMLHNFFVHMLRTMPPEYEILEITSGTKNKLMD